MKLTDIDPELRPSMRFIPRMRVDYPIVRSMIRLIGRIGLSSTPCDPSVSYEEHAIPNALVRVYTPKGTPSGIGILWIHGGGLIVGNVAQDNRICSLYAKELNAVVVSVEYRLAPENPYPAGLDDCFDAWQWFQEHAQKYGVSHDQIAVAGQSGGGCLAASLCQKISEDKEALQPAAQLLWCPMLDDRTSINYELDNINHLVWNNRSNRAAWSWYLGDYFAADTVPPYAVPARYKDVSSMPPTWIGVGDIDLFYEESVTYSERLKAAGIKCEMDIVSSAHHGFEIFAHNTKLVERYYQRHFSFVRSTFGVSG